MSLYSDALASDPPRFAVVMARNADGSEGYQWAVRGAIPVLNLVGAIGKVQAELQAGQWMPESEFEHPALVMVYNREDGDFATFLHPDIPVMSLCGMLEVIKALIVASKVAQQNGSQQFNLCGPDGRPMRR